MTPFRMRLFVVAFLALAAATSINALYMQEAPRSTAAAVKGAVVAGGGSERPSSATAALPEAKIPHDRIAALIQPANAPLRETAAPPRTEELPEPTPRVKAIQRELALRGYSPGRHDGVLSLESRAAILAYEFDEKMPLTGEATDALLKALIFAKAMGKTKIGAPDRFEQRRDVVQQAQQTLAQLGYSTGPADGRLDTTTRDAIRRFEADRRLKASGRLTERVLLEMVVVVGKPFSA